MTGSYIRRLAMGVAAVALSVGMAGAAHATPIAAYSTDGGITFTDLTLGTGVLVGQLTTYSFGGNVGSFGISGSIGTDYPGTPGQAQVVSSAVNLVNNSSSIASIIFAFSDGGFSAPTAPPILQLNSHIGGTVNTATPNNTLSFVSCVTPSASSPTTSCSGGTSSPLGTPDITQATSFQNDQYALFSSLTGPYAITELMNVQLGGSGAFGFQANSTLAYVPEPMSVALMGVGLLGLTIVYRRRRQA